MAFSSFQLAGLMSRHVARMAASCRLLNVNQMPSLQSQYASSASSNNQLHEAPEESTKQHVSHSHHFNVRASYLGADIDVNASSLNPLLVSRALMVSRDFSVFTLKPLPLTLNSSAASKEAQAPSIGPGSGIAEDEEMLLDEAKRFGVLVAFKFGSVVFVVPRSSQDSNYTSSPSSSSSSSSSDHEHSTYQLLASEEKKTEDHACEILQSSLASILRPKKEAPSLSDCIGIEEAHLVVRPSMKRDFQKERDQVVVPELDIGNLEVICRVLGQSAALDFYARTTEQQVEALDAVLAELASNAGKPFYQRPFLFRRLRGGRLLSRIASSSM